MGDHHQVLPRLGPTLGAGLQQNAGEGAPSVVAFEWLRPTA
jgi:hypothetical protein